MYSKNNLWLELLDKWTIKQLNFRGKLPWETDKSYWYTFRGARNLYADNSASYINHCVNRIMNDQISCEAVKCCTIRTSESAFKNLKLTLHDGKSDQLSKVTKLDQVVIKALHNADVRYISQLCVDSIAMTKSQFDEIAMNAPPFRSTTEEPDQDIYEGWGKLVLKEVRAYLRASKITEQNDRILTGNIDIFSDGSVKNGMATTGVYTLS